MSEPDEWLSRFLRALIARVPDWTPAMSRPRSLADVSTNVSVTSAAADHADRLDTAALEKSIEHDTTAQVVVQPKSHFSITVSPIVHSKTALSVILTPNLLHRLGARDPESWSPILVDACDTYDVNVPRRIAAILANILVETGDFSNLIESLNYSPQGLLATWPNRFTQSTALALGRTASKPANQQAIAETAYGGRLGNRPAGSGDGWRFRGRGLIQLTGRANYSRFAERINVSIEALPELLADRKTAALSAAQFWAVSGCNELADRNDIAAVRQAVNGGTIGLDEVRATYRDACRALAIQ